MRVWVHRRVGRPGIAPRRLKQIVAAALRREHAPEGTAVSVVLVDDPAIRRLNRRFLRRDRATDVLAFPMNNAASGKSAPPRSRILGEVVISIDRARAQARRAGHSVRAEVALLAVHGVLHLTGYEDHSAAQFARMDRRQRQILREIGEEVRG
ncbi:MAG TPA: rRNA maturation RNase YbeY [bacterium]|jgi:probable rRNA maturation factor